MREASSSQITQLRRAWQGGDDLALQQLTPVVYEELHRMAQYYMAKERDGHTQANRKTSEGGWTNPSIRATIGVATGTLQQNSRS